MLALRFLNPSFPKFLSKIRRVQNCLKTEKKERKKKVFIYVLLFESLRSYPKTVNIEISCLTFSRSRGLSLARLQRKTHTIVRCLPLFFSTCPEENKKTLMNTVSYNRANGKFHFPFHWLNFKLLLLVRNSKKSFYHTYP